MELLTHFLQLPAELQSLLREYLLVKVFKEWYYMANNMRYDSRPYAIRQYYFQNVLLWSHRILKASFNPNAIRPSSPLLMFWELGMVYYFEKTPTPTSYLFSRFTKFQQFMFKRIFALEQQNRRIEITFENVQSAPDGKHISAPHYLIIIQDRDNHVQVNSNFIKDCLDTNHVKDPVEARAK